MERIEEISALYVAMLQSIYLTHKRSHWRSAGENFYGKHLLLDRIAKTAEDDADLAAEKLIGHFGSEVVDHDMQSQFIGRTLKLFSDEEPIRASLEAENKFLTYSKKFMEILEKEGKLTPGLSNCIEQIADNREGAVYLLQQSLKNQKETTMNDKMANRISELKRIKTAQQTDNAKKLQAKINLELTTYLGNKNWGAVGFSRLFVADQNGNYTVNYDVVIPKNSPPYKQGGKGFAAFKQEIMDFVSQVSFKMGFGAIEQVLTVNGK